MATTEREEEVEYESDPDETKGSLVMRRRRAASDEEEERVGADGGRDGEDGGDAEGEKVKRVEGVEPEESDSEGVVADYDEDEEEEEYYSEGEEGDYEDGAGGYDEEGVDSGAVAYDVVVHERVVDKGDSEPVDERDIKETDGAIRPADNAADWGDEQGEEEDEGNLEGKKENEPFAVPTAGTFYMHDDRFRDNVGGRNR